MTKTTRIFGPPGTGKTTKLLEIVENALSRGVHPESIAYLSFSTKAAQEAISRACKKFNIEEKRFKYFRTIHSLGFYAQSLRRDEIMDYDDYKSIADDLGLEISKFNDEDDRYGNKDGDNCKQIMDLARAKCHSIEEEWKDAEKQVSIPYSVIEQWESAVIAYKQKYGKHDFGDMLEKYKGPLPVEILIVDEAQDLSKLQWKVVKEAAAGASELYIAGDDDQCIYMWNGADVDSFLDAKVDEEIVLPKSYRVPKELLSLANNIAGRINKRKVKSWEPVGAGGNIERDCDLYGLPIEQGEWMILVRNTKFIDSVEKMLKQKGYLYINNKYKSNNRSIKLEDSHSITNWERLRKGERITMGAANDIIKRINPKVERLNIDDVSMAQMPFVESFKKKPWFEVFEKSMNAHQIEYIRSCLRNGQRLTERPRIIVSTIHRVKGGEAENVAILPDYSYLSHQYIDDDSEHRVQYVAVTRAKKNLYLIRPEEEFFYEY